VTDVVAEALDFVVPGRIETGLLGSSMADGKQKHAWFESEEI
jgi:hypothetical protein